MYIHRVYTEGFPATSGKSRVSASIAPSTLARSPTSRLLSTYSIVRTPFLNRTKS